MREANNVQQLVVGYEVDHTFADNRSVDTSLRIVLTIYDAVAYPPKRRTGGLRLNSYLSVDISLFVSTEYE